MQITEQLRTWVLESTTFFEVFGLIVLGAAGKRLLSKQPLTFRLLIGEAALSAVAAVAVTVYGEYNSIAHGNIIMIGCIVSLIGIDGVITLVKGRLR